jgi:hypothetical protein
MTNFCVMCVKFSLGITSENKQRPAVCDGRYSFWCCLTKHFTELQQTVRFHRYVSDGGKVTDILVRTRLVGHQNLFLIMNIF